MKTVVISVRNLLFAQGLELVLKKTGNFRPYRVTPSKPENAAAECIARRADILLMDVGPQAGLSLEARMAAAEEIRRERRNVKIVLLCDEVAYPELAKAVMRTKQSGQIDAFYYASVPAEYLVDALDAI